MDIEALERQELRKKQIMVGALFAVAILLALVFTYWMGALGFGATRSIYLRYSFAGGIDRGSPVRLAGIRIGRVTDLKFSAPSGASAEQGGVLMMKLDLEKSALEQITVDSKFYINLAGLIGERYIEIVPGTGTPVAADQTLRGVDPPRIDQLLSQGYGIFGDLRQFFNENRGDLKEIFTTLNELSKNMNKLMSSASPQQRKQLSTLLTDFAEMSEDLKRTVAGVRSGVEHVQQHGGAQSWDRATELIQKLDEIHVNDLRRLMLEDGVKVNFSSKKIPPEFEQKR